MTNSLIEDQKRIWKTGLYIRLSKEDGDKEESNSITNQRAILKNHAKNSYEFQIIEEYVDDGFSGTNTNRPMFKKMLSDVREGIIDCVIVKDLSRFCRDHLEAGTLIEREFSDLGVRFIAVLDDYDTLNKENPIEDLIFPMKNIFNELYSRDLSRKVKRSFETNQKAGKYMGAFACYGYLLDPENRYHLVIDEYAAGIVKRIFSLYLSGISMRKIADILNDEKILSPAEYKRYTGSTYRTGNQKLETSFWNRCSISEILHNEVYIGNLVQGKTEQGIRKKKKRVPHDKYIIVENTHEAIIDRDTYYKAQKSLENNVRLIKNEQHDSIAIFAGFLRCGDCGCAMTQYRQKNNIAYKCSQYTRSGSGHCSSHYTSQIKLSKVILEDLNIIIQSIKELNELVEKQKKKITKRKSNIDISSIDIEIKRKRDKKLRAYSDYQEDLLTKEDYKSFCEECDKAITLLEQKKEFVINEQKKVNDFQEIPWVKNLLELGQIESLDRSIIYEMIEKITVYEDRTLVIKYRFSDELETLIEMYK